MLLVFEGKYFWSYFYTPERNENKRILYEATLIKHSDKYLFNYCIVFWKLRFVTWKQKRIWARANSKSNSTQESSSFAIFSTGSAPAISWFCKTQRKCYHVRSASCTVVQSTQVSLISAGSHAVVHAFSIFLFLLLLPMVPFLQGKRTCLSPADLGCLNAFPRIKGSCGV